MDAKARTIREPAALAAAGLADPDRLDALERVAARFSVAITPVLADLIDPEDPDDPIRRQFVPDPRELETDPVERADPIGDAPHSPVEGIVHRYPDRVLLKPVHVCPAYCRFCFRREAVGHEGGAPLPEAALRRALDYVAAHEEIWEVILTGGDPLALSARRLGAIVATLERIAHVRVVRIHTRVPVMAPERVDAALVRALRPPCAASGQAVYVVLHANHARELGPAARAACARFVDAGIPMLAQTVLLAGVNDDPETLGALLRALVETRVKPYYLHHPDLAPGTGHFRLPVARGQALMRALRGRYSGLCQPTYVLDVPGGHGKVPIGPAYLGSRAGAGDGAESYAVEDYRGRVHAYPPPAGEPGGEGAA